MTDEKANAQPAPVSATADIADVERIPLEDLVARAQAMAGQGARLVTLTCVQKDEGFEVLYHFDRDLKMSHLSVEVPAGGKLPSITGAYLCAFLVENEIEDLFGLPVDGMPLDYRRHLVLASDAAPAPLLKQQGQQ
jgi:Ni,Fe-hydrogenase III component G